MAGVSMTSVEVTGYGAVGPSTRNLAAGNPRAASAAHICLSQEITASWLTCESIQAAARASFPASTRACRGLSRWVVLPAAGVERWDRTTATDAATTTTAAATSWAVPMRLRRDACGLPRGGAFDSPGRGQQEVLAGCPPTFSLAYLAYRVLTARLFPAKRPCPGSGLTLCRYVRQARQPARCAQMARSAGCVRRAGRPAGCAEVAGGGLGLGRRLGGRGALRQCGRLGVCGGPARPAGCAAVRRAGAWQEARRQGCAAAGRSAGRVRRAGRPAGCAAAVRWACCRSRPSYRASAAAATPTWRSQARTTVQCWQAPEVELLRGAVLPPSQASVRCSWVALPSRASGCQESSRHGPAFPPVLACRPDPA